VSRPPTHPDVVEWVAFLRDIGVRELRASASDDREPGSDPSPEPTAPVSRGRDDSGSLFATPDEQALASAGSLDEIRAVLGECTRCKLHAGRKNVVFGVGNPEAEIMFVGEGPGADEDEQGEPFVGRAGRKLNEIVQAMGFAREQVYIANIVKCRPPGNRDPQPDEVSTCSPFLFAQIDAIRPKVLVTLGAPATRTLLGVRIGIKKLRGTWHEFRGTPVMPTYHPAFLLRAYTQENRQAVWDDMKAVLGRLGRDP
jgi:DNA polymerase